MLLYRHSGKQRVELDYSTLKEYDPPVTTRVFSSDGKLLDEFSIEERLFVPVNQMPENLIKAFLSSEDKKIEEVDPDILPLKY